MAVAKKCWMGKHLALSNARICVSEFQDLFGVEGSDVDAEQEDCVGACDLFVWDGKPGTVGGTGGVDLQIDPGTGI